MTSTTSLQAACCRALHNWLYPCLLLLSLFPPFEVWLLSRMPKGCLSNVSLAPFEQVVPAAPLPAAQQWPGTGGRLRTASGATRSFGRAHVCLLWCRASSPAAGLHFPTGCALNRAGCCSSARSVCAARSAPKPVGSRLPLLAAGSAPGVFLSPALPRTPLPPAPPDSPLGSGRRAQELGAPRGSP